MESCKIICISQTGYDKDISSIKENFAGCDFIKSIDMDQVTSNNILRFFKHYDNDIFTLNTVKTIMNHYNAWEKIANSNDNIDIYFIIDEAVTTPKTISLTRQLLLKKTNDQQIIFVGGNSDLQCQDLNIRPFDHKNSNFLSAYLITKLAVKILLEYIYYNGIKTTINKIINDCFGNCFESIPYLFIVNSQNEKNVFDNKRITFPMIDNNFEFNDYIFYPNLDSAGNDICEVYADIPTLREIANKDDNCIGFNTYGWIKFFVTKEERFTMLKNKYYRCDGLYVKKRHDQLIKKRNTIMTQDKIKIVREKLSNSFVKIFVNNDAKKYSWHLVEAVLKIFPNYKLVGPTDNYDISINHLVEQFIFRPDSFNILITGEPTMNITYFDMCIDTKYTSQSSITVYYPFIFSSMREHRKSLNHTDYIKPKTKFCAYMYNMRYPHRIWYFNLVSKYRQVDALGKCCNNVDIKDSRSHFTEESTYNDIAIELYSEYKFVLALENIFWPGYSTEKLINPMIANSIPIYWGDSTIFKHINKKRTIYIPDFPNETDLLEHIKNIDTNDELYKSIINEPIYINPDFSLDKLEENLSINIGKVFSDQEIQTLYI
ncbi:putative fucosyltransferase [Hirudovirus strain Sangsue]|nr:putative fucosyltransferase [Hirudovirus strain Sangsue]